MSRRYGGWAESSGPQDEHETRAAALEMLRAGLATQAEVAELAGVRRQYIHKLIIQEGLDAVTERRAWLRKAWREVIRQL